MPLGAFRINTLGKTQAVAAAPDIEQAVEFDGASDTLRRSGGLASDSANFLFSGWIYHDTADTEERTYMVAGIQSGSKIIAFTSLTGSGDGKFYIYARNSGGTTLWQVQTSQSVWDGKWHHIMASWNGTTGHLYVDGVSDKVENTNTSGNINWNCNTWAVGSNRYDGLEGGPVHTAEIYCTNEYLDLSSSANRDKFFDSTNKTPVSLGTDGSTPTGTQPLIYFSGEASVWNAGTNFGSTTGWSMVSSVTDSDQEPIELTSFSGFTDDANTTLLVHSDTTNGSTTFTDDVSSGRSSASFTLFNQVQHSTTQAKFGATSIKFDGVDDVLKASGGSLPGNLGTSDFTVECWVYFNTLSANSNFIDFRTAGGAQAPTVIAGAANSNLLLYAPNSVKITGTTGAISTGQWYHVAYSRSGSNHRIFLDGVQQGSTWVSAINYSSCQYAFGCFLNGSTPGGGDHDGYIDEIRMSDTARYTSDFTPPG